MKGSGIVLGIMFFPFWILFWDPYFLHVFLAICSILELEAAMPTVFAKFWSWNLSLSIEFAATFWWSL